MSAFKRQDIVTVLTYVSRNDMERERLLQLLSNEISNPESIIKHLLDVELILNRNGGD